MKRIRSRATTMTSKGQVTVPVEIRRRLGLRPGDKVRFEDDGSTVRVVRQNMLSLDEIFASARPVRPDLTVEQAITEARQERGEYLIKKYERMGLKFANKPAR